MLGVFREQLYQELQVLETEVQRTQQSEEQAVVSGAHCHHLTGVVTGVLASDWLVTLQATAENNGHQSQGTTETVR